jgi:hypothetical protein
MNRAIKAEFICRLLIYTGFLCASLVSYQDFKNNDNELSA